MNDAAPDGGYLYERLAGAITHRIASGTFATGDRLPSVREASRRERLSLATVLKAYRLLEDRGLLETRPQSGFYVKHTPGELPPAPAVSAPAPRPYRADVGRLVQEVISASARPEVVPLGAALPATALLPVAQLMRRLSAASRRDGQRAAADVRPEGLPELRQAIARRALAAGCEVGSGEVIVTNGCMEALSLALRAVTRPGDTVAVESPTYFGVLQLIAGLHLRVLELPTDPGTGLRVEAARRAVDAGLVQAFLLNPTFHNPLGALMPDPAREELVEFLDARDIPLVEDDLYGELHPGGGPGRPRALKAFDRRGKVLYCGSFSKTLAPGFRVGWIVPGRWHERVYTLKAASTLGTSAPAQIAIADYLQGGGYAHHLRRLGRTFATSLDRMAGAVARRFPADTRVSRPAGGFVLWVQVPGVDTLDLYRRALAAGVGIAPGCMFTATAGYRDCFRLNAGHPWSDRIEAAVEGLGQVVGEMRDGRR